MELLLYNSDSKLSKHVTRTHVFHFNTSVKIETFANGIQPIPLGFSYFKVKCSGPMKPASLRLNPESAGNLA